MNQNTERSAIWKALRAAGWEPAEGRKYVNYPRQELIDALVDYQTLTGLTLDVVLPLEETPNVEAPAAPEPTFGDRLEGAGLEDLPELLLPSEPLAEIADEPTIDPESLILQAPPRAAPAPEVPVAPPVQLTDLTQAAPPVRTDPVRPPGEVPFQAAADPKTLPGARTHSEGSEPIRRDENGRLWYQEEVRKPAFPKPRGRRILRYLEKGVKTETVVNGEYVESFEVAGEGPGKPAEIRITLPSYQVGIYKDPRFPFKIHCYNGAEGFNLNEVEEFYGGVELVPETVKRIYIENDLCYDIRSVVRAIQAEHRQNQLTGRVPR